MELVFRRIVPVIIVAFFITGAAPGRTAETQKEKAAISAAEQWLAGVDKGKYAESWQNAAGYFRSAVTQDQWEQAVRAARGPLGKLVSRKLERIAYTKTLPGAPDGEYVVIQFNSVFEHKKAAVETVTPMLAPDGTWRVSGYFIR